MKDFGTVIILAGGKSSRMGFDKQFLEINKKRIMEDVISKLKNIFDEIIIVTNKPEEYKVSKYIIIEDIIKGRGALSGIHAGLSISNSIFAYVIACDMPNINLEYIELMMKRLKENNKKAVVTKYEKWIEPLNAFYSREIISEIEGYLNEDKASINDFLRDKDILYIEESKAREFSPSWNMFKNLNTQEEVNEYIKEYDKR